MKIEKVIGNLSNYEVENRTIEKVPVEWFELEKKLLRKTTDAGEELGIRVETPLKDGDVLYADDTRVIAVDTIPAELTRIPVSDIREMGRLCFELGNRHLSLSISEDQVLVPYDAPTFEYLQHIGFQPQKVIEKFTHFTVCHAHGHSHGEAHSHSHEQG